MGRKSSAAGGPVQSPIGCLCKYFHRDRKIPEIYIDGGMKKDTQYPSVR